MTISEQIKVLCVRTNISVSELARRMGMSPQNLNAKLKRETFTVSDLDQIAEAIAMLIKEGESAIEPARAIVKELTDKYPLQKFN